jgi:hypothetical protein
MKAIWAAAIAIGLATLLAGCGSSSLNLGSFGFGGSSQASAADDDTKCQSAGYTYGTPEYNQCLQNLVQQRASVDSPDSRPHYVPQH